MVITVKEWTVSHSFRPVLSLSVRTDEV